MYQYNASVLRSSPIHGRRAGEIASSIETAVRTGALRPGDRVPPVRDLSASLGVSPATVASAYRSLQDRGVLVGRGRQGTRVTQRPPLAHPPVPPVPPGIRNLADGNPDPALLPPLAPALARLDPRPRLYGEAANDPGLLDVARRRFGSEGIPDEHVTVVGGALDGIERVLQAHLRHGDRVAVEDPGYPGVLDLVGALGMSPDPVRMDDAGPIPQEVERALRSGARALILTPRAQNPTGAALDEGRTRALRSVIRGHPEVLVVEDDHAGPVSGRPPRTLCGPGRPHWAVVRSVSKSLGPDLRLALMAGDAGTVARVEGRRLVGAGWVSHLLQQVALWLLTDPDAQGLVRLAEETYAARREGMLRALAARGLPANGRSGLNVWVPVADEGRAVQILLQAGWAVRAGARFRMAAPPGVRITIATVQHDEAERLADALARSVEGERRTRPA
jgi:DNA-binding transcriptional MocR family regulator